MARKMKVVDSSFGARRVPRGSYAPDSGNSMSNVGELRRHSKTFASSVTLYQPLLEQCGLSSAFNSSKISSSRCHVSVTLRRVSRQFLSSPWLCSPVSGSRYSMLTEQLANVSSVHVLKSKQAHTVWPIIRVEVLHSAAGSLPLCVSPTCTITLNSGVLARPYQPMALDMSKKLA